MKIAKNISPNGIIYLNNNVSIATKIPYIICPNSVTGLVNISDATNIDPNTNDPVNKLNNTNHPPNPFNNPIIKNKIADVIIIVIGIKCLVAFFIIR